MVTQLVAPEIGGTIGVEFAETLALGPLLEDAAPDEAAQVALLAALLARNGRGLMHQGQPPRTEAAALAALHDLVRRVMSSKPRCTGRWASGRTSPFRTPKLLDRPARGHEIRRCREPGSVASRLWRATAVHFRGGGLGEMAAKR